MKIGFDAKRAFHNNRGLGNYSRDLIRILHNFSEYSLILFNPKSKDDSRISIDKNTIIITPKNPIFKFFHSFWRLFCISKIVKNQKLDIYHGLSGEIPFSIYKHTKTIVTIHDLIFLSHPHLYSFIDRIIYTQKFKYAAVNSHQIIAISQQTKNEIVKYFNIKPDKISVVYQGCHAAFKLKYTQSQKEEISKKYSLPTKFILNVGAIEQRKNVLEIVKAIKDIDIKLVLVGKRHPYYNQILQYCQQFNIQNKVIILQGLTMEELAIVYQCATIFCYPSIVEGFGIPIIEALFSGVPVITSKGGCFQEAAGKNSLFVDPNKNTHIQIQNHINTILSDPILAQNMIKKGYIHAQNFTDEAIFNSLNSVYENLLNKTL